MSPRTLSVMLLWNVGISTALGQGWTLTRVADSSTPVPGEVGTFTTQGNGPFGAPALAPSGRVAFWGGYNVGARDGIFTDAPGSLSVVANRNTLIPGSAQPFTAFEHPVSWDGSTFALTGLGPAGRGVYTTQSGPLARIADSSTQVPGGSTTFTTVGGPSVDGSRLVFGGLWGSPMTDGLFRTVPGGIATIVDHTTILPGSATPVSGLGQGYLSGSTMVFGAATGSRVGLFATNINGAGFSQIVDSTTPIPGGSGSFLSFTTLSHNAGNVAFIAQDDQTRPGLYASLNGQLLNIADTIHAGPLGRQFGVFYDVAISGDSIAFTAGAVGFGTELWVWRNGEFSRVVGRGDVLNGITVGVGAPTIFIGPESLKGDTVAFSFINSNIGIPVLGGVYTAAYLPGPGVAVVMGAGWIVVARRRRTRLER